MDLFFINFYHYVAPKIIETNYIYYYYHDSQHNHHQHPTNAPTLQISELLSSLNGLKCIKTSETTHLQTHVYERLNNVWRWLVSVMDSTEAQLRCVCLYVHVFMCDFVQIHKTGTIKSIMMCVLWFGFVAVF